MVSHSVHLCCEGLWPHTSFRSDLTSLQNRPPALGGEHPGTGPLACRLLPEPGLNRLPLPREGVPAGVGGCDTPKSSHALHGNKLGGSLCICSSARQQALGTPPAPNAWHSGHRALAGRQVPLCSPRLALQHQLRSLTCSQSWASPCNPNPNSRWSHPGSPPPHVLSALKNLDGLVPELLPSGAGGSPAHGWQSWCLGRRVVLHFLCRVSHQGNRAPGSGLSLRPGVHRDAISAWALHLVLGRARGRHWPPRGAAGGPSSAVQ